MEIDNDVVEIDYQTYYSLTSLIIDEMKAYFKDNQVIVHNEFYNYQVGNFELAFLLKRQKVVVEFIGKNMHVSILVRNEERKVCDLSSVITFNDSFTRVHILEMLYRLNKVIDNNELVFR